jgi:hypothetical protein
MFGELSTLQSASREDNLQDILSTVNSSLLGNTNTPSRYTPQWYPECAQLVITGSGTASPSGSYLTAIPSYAAATDPGVYVSVRCKEFEDHS